MEERTHHLYALAVSSLANSISYEDLRAGLTAGTFQNGPDRITQVKRSVVAADGSKPDLTRTDTYVWLDGSSTPVCLSTNLTSADGLQSWSVTPAGTSHSRTVYGGSGYRYTTNTAPDGSYSVSTYQNGRLFSVVRKDANNATVGSTTYTYDAHGRQASATDAQNGTTTYTYNNADLVQSVTTPSPGASGGFPQTTTTYYDKMLRATNVLQPDGASVFTEYYSTGEIKRNYGAAPTRSLTVTITPGAWPP